MEFNLLHMLPDCVEIKHNIFIHVLIKLDGINMIFIKIMV